MFFFGFLSLLWLCDYARRGVRSAASAHAKLMESVCKHSHFHNEQIFYWSSVVSCLCAGKRHRPDLRLLFLRLNKIIEYFIDVWATSDIHWRLNHVSWINHSDYPPMPNCQPSTTNLNIEINLLNHAFEFNHNQPQLTWINILMIAATFHSECNLPLISRIAKCKLTITDQHIYRQRHTWRLKMRARKDRHAVTPNAIVWGSIEIFERCQREPSTTKDQFRHLNHRQPNWPRGRVDNL